MTQLLPLIDGIPPVGGKPGHPKNHPDEVYADRAYHSEPHREELRKRGIEPHLAKRNQEHGSGLGIFRRVSERTLGWLHNFRRLRIRFDRDDEIHHAFLKIAESIICFRTLQTGLCQAFLVIVHAGGKSDKGVLAFQAAEGKLAWSVAAGEQSCSSVQVVTVLGQSLLVLLSDTGAQFWDMTGKSVLDYSWPHGGYRALQAQIIDGDKVLIPTGMGTGTRLVQLKGLCSSA